MIVTLTANPALDRTITLDAALRPGEVQSALALREDAGGKGVNVSRAIAAAGLATVAVLPIAVDDPYRAILQASGIPVRAVPVSHHVRTNTAITDPLGETTKLNLPGAALTAAEATALIAEVVEASGGADWLVLAGSLPLGVADTFYVEVIEAVRARWAADAPRIAVDTSGAALRAVVAHGAPDLIKPNEDELAELSGIPLPEGDLIDAAHRTARRLVPDRVAAALVTLGGEGAVLVTAEGGWAAAAPRVRVASTVGAGDSALAGCLIADASGADAADRLRSAIRYGAAAASLAGTQAPAPADLGTDAITVRSL